MLIKFLNILRDPTTEPGGGGGTETPPGDGQTPAQTPPVAPETPPDPKAQWHADFDRYGYNDEQREVAERMLDAFERMDAGQKVSTLIQAAKAEAQYGSRRSDDEDGKRRQRQQFDDDDDTPDDDAAAQRESRELRELRASFQAQKKMLDELLADKRGREAKQQQSRQRDEWKQTVIGAVTEHPGLKDLPEDIQVDLVGEALGWVAMNQDKHGNSQNSALKAWVDRKVAHLAHAAGVGVKEFLEGKAKATAATGETGIGGRPAASTEQPLTPADLKSGNVLQRAMAAAGLE